jgi:hypothetical protein
MPAISDPLPGFQQPKTYAAWPVWRDSTTAEVKFAPMSKKRAVQLFHKARAFERQTRQRGKQDGALGRNGIAVLHTMLFDFINYATGHLTPSYKAMAHKACISVRSVARGLKNLKAYSVLHWQRRAGETRDEHGRFCLKQDTNAYAVLPSSQWLGFIEPEPPPPPHPTAWGAAPPLPDLIEQAVSEITTAAKVRILEGDPNDKLAVALAWYGRALDARKPQ